MTKQTEAMKLALEALEANVIGTSGRMSKTHEAITALREALAEQPVQQERMKNELAMREPSAIRDRLIQAGWTPPTQQPAQQEPVAWMQNTTAGLYVIDHCDEWHCIPLYTSPPAQRKPLTGEEMNQIEARWDASMHGSKIAFVVRETEAAHGIKENT